MNVIPTWKRNRKRNNNQTSRYVLEIEKKDYSINVFTIMHADNGDNGFNLLQLATNLSPSKLLNLLTNTLSDKIPMYIIEIIVYYCSFNESIIAVSFATNIFKDTKLNEMYEYLSAMNNKLKDIRPTVLNQTTNIYVDEALKNVIGKVHDIIDPSLFVKCIDMNDNKYQWIPSTIEII
eukprot:481554_1